MWWEFRGLGVLGNALERGSLGLYHVSVLLKMEMAHKFLILSRKEESRVGGVMMPWAVR